MNRLLALLVDRMSFLKPDEKRGVFAAVGSPGELGTLSGDDLSRLIGRPLPRREWHFPLELRSAEISERWLDRQNVTLLVSPRETSSGPDGSRHESFKPYPGALGEIYDPPFLLYVRGEVDALFESEIAVVGTRRPDISASKAAYRFGAEAAQSGVSLVSGLARGIDSMVHRGAVSAGGPGVAILGSGIDSIYPRENRSLALSLIDRGGAIVSEYPPGVPPLKYHFPARNRIISGLVRGVLLLQAPERSGALITVDHALEQGREVFVHREGLGDGAGNTRSAGGLRLVESGAPVVSGFADVVRLLGMVPGAESDYSEGTTASPEAPGNATGWGNSLADRMARQLSLGQEEQEW
ncbi:MAG: DNA-processing protein DprA [Spirochaetaceae bacterium]